MNRVAAAELLRTRFFGVIGDRKLERYTDGGPGPRRNLKRARAAKAARRKNRR